MEGKNSEDRSLWAIGGTTLIGLGIGIIFIKTSVLVFLASLFIGIGAGILISSFTGKK